MCERTVIGSLSAQVWRSQSTGLMVMSLLMIRGLALFFMTWTVVVSCHGTPNICCRALGMLHDR